MEGSSQPPVPTKDYTIKVRLNQSTISSNTDNTVVSLFFCFFVFLFFCFFVF